MSCSRPLHGESIYLHDEETLKNFQASSRPLHGESIYLRQKHARSVPCFQFSSPPRGIYISTTLHGFHLLMIDLFSSPPRGIYISTLMRKSEMKNYKRSRPLHGESIYLQNLQCLNKLGCNQFSSPPRGIYISTITSMTKRLRKLWFSSPPRGIYISTSSEHPLRLVRIVLVPSTGNLYIYKVGNIIRIDVKEFSSPPRGIYISTRT